MPQLDGLRAFAAGVVVAQHMFLGKLVRLGESGLGIYGVWLFFVLSGFLITGILLHARSQPSYARGQTLRAFYARRSLRIFPLYFAVVLVCAAFGVGTMFRRDLGWFLTYLPNWRFALLGTWGDRPSGPTWSLGVEEQFYLVWPTLVLFLPRRWLGRLFVGTAVAGVLSRLVLACLAPHEHAAVTAIMPTTSNLDPLALGALLALHRHDAPGAVDARRRWTRAALGAGLVIVAVVAVLSAAHRGVKALLVLETLGAALVSVWLVNGAAAGFRPRSIAARVLGAAPVRYVGTISYGVYLLHQPIAYTLRTHAGVTLGLDGRLATGLAWGALVLAVAIAAASLSWFCFERPINRLKDRFHYVQRAPIDVPAAEGVREAAVA